jgi:hypothetical protein
MPQQNLIALAKQGNPEAISELINRSLKPKGILAKVDRKDDTLIIKIESSKALNQDSLIKFLHSGILKLEIGEINILEISGKQIEGKVPVWNQKIHLKPSVKPALSKDVDSQKIKVEDVSEKTRFNIEKVIRENWLVIGLATVVIGFAGWFVASEEYQATLEEISFNQAFGQLISSLFNSTSNSDSDDKNQLPEEITSYTQVGELEDVSYGSVERLAARIVVPLGRTQEELTATLERAAREIGKETRASAVMVFAYRPQDTPTDQYTAGRAVYAPNGRWEDAASSGEKQVSVDLNTLYFAAPFEGFPSGTLVTLSNSTGQEVYLSEEYDRWGDEDIVASILNGTEATVIEYRSEPMGEQEFVRYKVRVISGVDTINGWVHSSNIVGK